MDLQKQKNILHNLIKARDSIKRKYKLIKYNKDSTEQVLKETFQPIVEPLQKIASDVNKRGSEEEEEKKEDVKQNIFNQSKFDLSIPKLQSSFNNKSIIHPSTSKVNLLPGFQHCTPKKDSFKFDDTNSMNFSKSDFDQTIIKQPTEPQDTDYSDEYIKLLKSIDVTIDKIYGPVINKKLIDSSLVTYQFFLDLNLLLLVKINIQDQLD